MCSIPERERLSILADRIQTSITDEGDLRQAVEAISARNTYIRDVAAREGLKDFALYRLRTQSIEWLDYAKGQGHLDTLVVEA
jgi:hypothetical protein